MYLNYKVEHNNNGDIMLKKIDYFLLCLLIIMNIFSLIGLFNYDKILLYKQIIWILIGIVIILFITVIDNNIIYKNSHIIYIICNIHYIYIIYKELGHIIMKAEQSHIKEGNF